MGASVGWEGLADGWASLQGVGAASLGCSDFTLSLIKGLCGINLSPFLPAVVREETWNFTCSLFRVFNSFPLFWPLFLSIPNCPSLSDSRGSAECVLEASTILFSILFFFCYIKKKKKRGTLSLVVPHPILLVNVNLHIFCYLPPFNQLSRRQEDQYI